MLKSWRQKAGTEPEPIEAPLQRPANNCAVTPLMEPVLIRIKRKTFKGNER